MAGRRGAEEAENAGGSLQERGWFGRAMGPKGVWRGVWVNLEMMERESGGENEHIWQLRGERGRSLKKAEEWDLGRVERRKWGRKADRQAGWGGM